MISLVHLLTEASSAPKAIFLAGPAGSGKSYISKQLIPPSFNVINIDDSYEELLKASGMGMSQKDFGPEELSQAAKLMGQAQTREKYAELTKSKQNIIIDGTGAAILTSTLGSNNSLYTFQTAILSSALIPPRSFGDINTTT